MKLNVVKVKPNERPIRENIKIEDDIIYLEDKKGSELHLVNINDSRLKKVELEENIVALYIEPVIDENNIAYDISEYPMEKNKVINGNTIYGDYIIVSYINGIYTNLNEKYIEKYLDF